ncbi:MAG: helix-turn-helix domain-containing protein [Rhodoplanes sp.]
MDALLFSVSEACRILGIGRSKLYSLIAAGELTVRKVGRKTLIPRTELEGFAARLPIRFFGLEGDR